MLIKALWIVLSFQCLVWSEVYSADLDSLGDEPSTPAVVGILADMAAAKHSLPRDDEESEVEIAVIPKRAVVPKPPRLPKKKSTRDSLHNAFPPDMTHSQKRTSLIKHQQWVLEKKIKTGRWKTNKGGTIDEKLALVQEVFEDVLKKFDGDESIQYKNLSDRIGVSYTLFLKQYLNPNYYQRHLQKQAVYSGRLNQHPRDAIAKETNPLSTKKRAAPKPSAPPLAVDEESDDDVGGDLARPAKVQARKKIKKSFDEEEEGEEVSEERPKPPSSKAKLGDEESKIQRRASEKERIARMKEGNPRKYAAYLARKREAEALRRSRLKELLTKPQ